MVNPTQVPLESIRIAGSSGRIRVRAVADLDGVEEVVGSVRGARGLGAFRAVGPARVKGVFAPIWLHRLEG